MTEAGIGGRCALVTGAARGIGAAIAASLSEHGADVCLLDILEPDAVPPRGRFVRADVTDEAALEAARVDLAIAGRLPDILVVNAGINSRGALLDQPADIIRRIIDVNLYGALAVLRAFGRGAVESGRGRVVVTSSMVAVHALANRAVYTSTKGALSALVRALAVEWGPSGTTVNAVAPGIVRTAIVEGHFASHPELLDVARANTPLGRLCEATDVADAVTFLVSDFARFITGQTLVVDGGVTAGDGWF